MQLIFQNNNYITLIIKNEYCKYFKKYADSAYDV